MNLSLALALILFPASAFSNDAVPAAQQPSPTTANEPAKPAPDLARLEKLLVQKQEEKGQGRLTPEQYHEFAPASCSSWANPTEL